MGGRHQSLQRDGRLPHPSALLLFEGSMQVKDPGQRFLPERIPLQLTDDIQNQLPPEGDPLN